MTTQQKMTFDDAQNYLGQIEISGNYETIADHVADKYDVPKRAVTVSMDIRDNGIEYYDIYISGPDCCGYYLRDDSIIELAEYIESLANLPIDRS